MEMTVQPWATIMTTGEMGTLSMVKSKVQWTATAFWAPNRCVGIGLTRNGKPVEITSSAAATKVYCQARDIFSPLEADIRRKLPV